jgi:hypothetical protein
MEVFETAELFQALVDFLHDSLKQIHGIHMNWDSLHDSHEVIQAIYHFKFGYHEMYKLATSSRMLHERVRSAIPEGFVTGQQDRSFSVCGALLTLVKKQSQSWEGAVESARLRWSPSAMEPFILMEPVCDQLAAMPLLIVPVAATHGRDLEPVSSLPMDAWEPIWTRCLGRPLLLRLDRLGQRLFRLPFQDALILEVLVGCFPMIVEGAMTNAFFETLVGLTIPPGVALQEIEYNFVLGGEKDSDAGVGHLNVAAFDTLTGQQRSASFLCVACGYHPSTWEVGTFSSDHPRVDQIPASPPGFVQVLQTAYESWEAVWGPILPRGGHSHHPARRRNICF